MLSYCMGDFFLLDSDLRVIDISLKKELAV